MKHYKITFKHSEDKKLKSIIEVDAMNERQALDFAASKTSPSRMRISLE